MLLRAAYSAEIATLVPDLQGGELAPLSMEQELFYAARLAAPRRRVSIVRGLDIRGPLDTDKFLSSLAAVTARHEGLRVRIAHSADGEPGQRILGVGEEPPPVSCAEVKCNSRQQFEVYARAIARRDMQERWDPVADPLYRLRLLRRSEDEHILISTFDHLAFDERAIDIFEKGLWQAYAGSAAGDPGPSLQRCVVRQRERYGNRARTVSESYWARKYASAPPVFQPSGPGRAGFHAEVKRRMVSYRSDAAMIRELRSTCLGLGCSLFEVSVAVFGYLVFGLTMQDRISIYIPLDSREAAEKDVIGMFAGIRLLALSRPGADGVRAVLDQVRREVMRAMAHRHVDGRAEAAAMSGTYSRWNLAPRRQLVLNYFRHGAGQGAGQASGLRLTPTRYAPAHIGPAPYLGLFIDDAGDQFTATLHHTAGYLSDEEASDLLRKFNEQLPRAVVAAGDATPDTVRSPLSAPGLSPLRDRDGTVCLHADLAEVRAALLSQPAVSDAQVRVTPGEDGGDELTASVISAGRLTSTTLRDACLAWPQATQYMVPPTMVSPEPDVIHAGADMSGVTT
jgi:Condensation domain